MNDKRRNGRAAGLVLAAIFLLVSCGQAREVEEPNVERTGTEAGQSLTDKGAGDENVPAADGEDADHADASGQEDYAGYFENLERTESYKGVLDTNPIMSQRFGADPYALVYGDRVYFYMTADAFEYDAAEEIAENTYGSIQSISVVSTDDMVNFQDHGLIKVAGPDGAAKWAHNSWAPAATWKEVDGKPKFFLYFADNGGGIGVLTADNPTGPFRDELGEALISRKTPNCADVLWLFDPAVLTDEDGRAYLYFGGGVPEGKAAHPGTARAVELGEDRMSIIGEPVVVDAPYLFEDSGIHKVGDTYYYTYCSNWQVDDAGAAEYGFHSAEIVSMESKNPLGPFTVKEMILQNPGRAFGLYGNNHHCVFEFQNRWYIAYHSRALEKAMGVEHGYRCTHVEEFAMGEDGTIGTISQSLKGRKQLKPVDAGAENNATAVALMAGTDAVPADAESETYGCGEMALGSIDTGDHVRIQGVEFGEKTPASFVATVRCKEGGGVLQITMDGYRDVVGYLPVEGGMAEFTECRGKLMRDVTGVHDLYFTFYGSGYEIKSWRFE